MYRQGDYLQGGFGSLLGGAFRRTASVVRGAAGATPIGSAALGGLGAIRGIVRGGKTAPIGSSLVGTPGGKLARLRGLGGRFLATGAGIFSSGLPPMGGKMKMQPDGSMKKRRRMHVTNVKALRRGIRRLAGFEKLARRVLRITSPGKAHKIHGFKKAARKR
jgi:hypothetical protein